MVSYQSPVATTAINKNVAETIADLIPPRISESKEIMAIVKYQGELANTLSSGLSTPTVTALLNPAVSSSMFSVTHVTAASDASATCLLMSICFGKNAAQASWRERIMPTIAETTPAIISAIRLRFRSASDGGTKYLS
jgi:hypothetical protein